MTELETQALSIIRDCQNILAEHVDPSGPDAKETISRLLGILDGPRVREVFNAIDAQKDAK